MQGKYLNKPPRRQERQEGATEKPHRNTADGAAMGMVIVIVGFFSGSKKKMEHDLTQRRKEKENCKNGLHHNLAFLAPWRFILF